MKYGNCDGWYEALYSNFSTTSVMGNLSTHYSKMRSLLLTCRNTERNSNVIDWIERYVKILDKDIEINKIEEERYGGVHLQHGYLAYTNLLGHLHFWM